MRHKQASMSHISRGCDTVCPAGIASYRAQRQDSCGKRARRREAARLAQRQGAARRSGKTRPTVAPPRLLESFLPCECWSFRQTQLCSQNDKLQN
jgi:hypothetical protein